MNYITAPASAATSAISKASAVVSLPYQQGGRWWISGPDDYADLAGAQCKYDYDTFEETSEDRKAYIATLALMQLGWSFDDACDNVYRAQDQVNTRGYEMYRIAPSLMDLVNAAYREKELRDAQLRDYGTLSFELEKVTHDNINW